MAGDTQVSKTYLLVLLAYTRGKHFTAALDTSAQIFFWLVEQNGAKHL